MLTQSCCNMEFCFVFWPLPQNVSPDCSHQPNNGFGLGNTIVKCFCTDKSGNRDHCYFNIIRGGYIIVKNFLQGSINFTYPLSVLIFHFNVILIRQHLSWIKDGMTTKSRLSPCNSFEYQRSLKGYLDHNYTCYLCKPWKMTPSIWFLL